MAALVPRLHQNKAVEATFEFLAANDGSGLVVAPVAAGKSLIIAETIKRACSLFPQTNCLVLTHIAKLLLQDEEELKGQWPEARTSFYSDKLKKKDFSGQIIFASINSIYKKAYKIPRCIDLIFIDEAHLISPDGNTMYRKFLADMRIINPFVRIIGYTGTNFRATEGRLTEGPDKLFDSVIYQIPMLYLIEKGFLCPLITPPVRTRMSTAGVKTSKGDYVTKQLAAAIDKDPITIACVDEIIEHGVDRKKWLVFTADIQHCKNVTEEIRSRGISCEMITSEIQGDTEKIYARFKSGEIRCLVNVSMVTTGVNVPAIDLLVFMRPSRSPVLYVQMAGRGMRIYPGKTNCMLLDFGGVVAELGPVDLVDAYKASNGNGTGEAPIKPCPRCNSICFAGARYCHDCEYEFPPSPLALTKTAASIAVMSNQIEPEWQKVVSISYKSHLKAGKTAPTLCVTYHTLAGLFREYICYEHTGGPREKAARWHRRMSDLPVPHKVSEALKIAYKKPTGVLTRQVGKYFEIIDYFFE